MAVNKASPRSDGGNMLQLSREKKKKKKGSSRDVCDVSDAGTLS